MSYPGLSILIPAAGASRRLGQAKQLVRHKAGTLIQNIVDSVNSIAPREIIVVTGAHAEAVKKAVQGPPVRWVHNANWSAGLGGSIATGAEIISPGSLAVMILLCDQWRLESADLRLLAETWLLNPERIACARAGGQNMPPAIFPRRYFGQLGALTGDSGARNLLKAQAEMLVPVSLENARFDLDTQSQLKQKNSADL